MENQGKRTDLLVNLPKGIEKVHTAEKLSKIAGVSEKTYRMGANHRRPDRLLSNPPRLT